MTDPHLYPILTSTNPASVRLGWVSFSTGITYCGICLRAEIVPEVGATCSACGAQVAQVLDITARGEAWSSAWKQAFTGECTRKELSAMVAGARAS